MGENNLKQYYFIISTLILSILLLGAEKMTQPKIQTKTPLVYLMYKGPMVPVNRNMIKTIKEIQGNPPHEYFRVWLNEDCFVITVEKYVEGRIIWKDNYTYEKADNDRSWKVYGSRKIRDNIFTLKFDDNGYIIKP
jgi:hypothetical protein